MVTPMSFQRFWRTKNGEQRYKKLMRMPVKVLTECLNQHPELLGQVLCCMEDFHQPENDVKYLQIMKSFSTIQRIDLLLSILSINEKETLKKLLSKISETREVLDYTSFKPFL